MVIILDVLDLLLAELSCHGWGVSSAAEVQLLICLPPYVADSPPDVTHGLPSQLK